MSGLQNAYHRLPGPMRTVAASLRGAYLRSWRYGPETDGLVGSALERESWGPERWRAWQEGQLAQLLHRAAATVPYYQEQWLERRRRGDRSSVERLENWPILKKDTLRAQTSAFVAQDRDRRSMFPEHTSGTTGKPLQLWWTKDTVRRWYALFEARVRLWNGLTRHHRWAIFGGQPVVPARQTEPPFWVWNAGLRQLYMSSYHLAPSHVEGYLEALQHYRVEYLLGYPSAMSTLVQIAAERGLKAPKLRVAISNAEPFYRRQRQEVAQAFGCPVRDTYGMAEIVSAASECPAGTLHLWPEVGWTEVVGPSSDVEVVAPGQTGRLVCTGLLNMDMPLVRYEVGDLGSVAPREDACQCGRRLPILLHVEGRLDDVVVTPDGRRIGRLDPVFKGEMRIREAQVIQETLGRLRVRVIPIDGFGRRDIDSIVEGLESRLGKGMEIFVEPVSEIPRTPGGKFRAVISLVDQTR